MWKSGVLGLLALFAPCLAENATVAGHPVAAQSVTVATQAVAVAPQAVTYGPQAVTIVPQAVHVASPVVAVPLTVVAPAALGTCVAPASVVSLAAPTIVEQRVVVSRAVRPLLFPSRSVTRSVVRSRF